MTAAHRSRRARSLVAATAAAGLLAALLFPDIASAHALVGRKDLPVPAWLFAWGASLVLIVSFALLSVAWPTPRLQRDRWRPIPSASPRAGQPGHRGALRAIGVGLLAVSIYAGLRGTEAPDRNFSITFVFYTAWLGVVVASVFLGDVFRAFNPWRAIGRAFAGVFRLVAGQSGAVPFGYPDWLGHWPAVLGVLLFVWLELVHGASGLSLATRRRVATIVYSLVTFVSMALFGVERWVERGETFSVYFGMFSKLAPFETRQGKLGVREFAHRRDPLGRGPRAARLVLTSIGLTSYDGATEGALKEPIKKTFDLLRDVGLGVADSFRVNDTIWMLLVIAGVSLLFWLGIRGMHTIGARRRSASCRGPSPTP